MPEQALALFLLFALTGIIVNADKCYQMYTKKHLPNAVCTAVYTKERLAISMKEFAKKVCCGAMLILSLVSCKKAAEQELTVGQEADKQKLSAATANLNANLNSNLQKPITLGYFPSWSEGWLGDDGKSKFTTLPATITHVFLAFAKPNMRYVKNSFDIGQTGLECYSGNGNMLKRAVGILKERGINVILSVGGESYWNTPESFNDISYQQIKDLVDDMGFVGIDWDFEPNGSFSESGSALNVGRLTKYITESRKLMPKSAGYIIATAPAGVGALGGQVNDDPSSPFAYAKRNAVTGEADSYLYQSSSANNSISLFGFSTTGAMIPVIKAAGDKIDIIAYQAYNTGAAPNRKLMYDSYAYYANIYGFRLAHGTHVPNEPWGPLFEHTPAVVADLAKYIYEGGSQKRAGKNDGIMIWQLNQTSAKGTNYTGVTYLNVASKVLSGQSTASALANAFDYEGKNVTIPTEPAKPEPNKPTTPTEPSKPTTPIAGGCGIAGYDATKSYATAGTKVYYKGKIYKNKWWVNANQAPETEQWGPWEFVENCDGKTVPNVPEKPVDPVPAKPVNPPAKKPEPAKPNGCGIAAYEASKSYPTAGTLVFYNGKIYKNKWWANPNQAPEAEQWGPWEFVKNCK